MAQNLKIKRFFFEFTRPADTTAYTAQDAVSDSTSTPSIITWIERTNPNLNVNQLGLVVGGSYQIKSVKLVKSTNTTTNASFDIYFYTSGVTNTNDNAEMGITYADKIYRIGKTAITLSVAGSTQSTCAESVNTDVNYVFIANDTKIYSIITATAAYTPGNAEKFYGELELIRIDE